ncbi:MAG: vitamin B12-dependent ribonucleotide reductase [Gemmatimonadales bacterium]|nr:MAG: vitamin B12-dependent ribonucleotide reductase [Gemmatimonadales bacterium]
MPARKESSSAALTPSHHEGEPRIFDDRIPADLPRAELSDNARIVLAKRYLKKNEEGEPVEEPETMFWRVARVIAEEDRQHGASDAAIEELARHFYDLMSRGKFEPNSPTLMNAGRPLGQLSACFVLPVDDALSNGQSGIYDTLKSMALVHQSGGGTGFSFSRLRATGDTVRSTMGVASGPVSFMKLYDASTEVVKQGGTRRGANMGILRVDHPDVREFITCKDDTSQITNFNISLAITDAFMDAVAAGSDYELKSARTGEVVGTENAREIFDMIVHGAWKTGEPGVFFIDRANEYNPVPALGSYEATNPCGEQPLLPYDVCNLGSVNVGKFVNTTLSDDVSPEDRIDWESLRTVVHLSTHFLDNVIDANRYPLPQITELAQNIRRVGLGIMGWADLLVRCGVPYSSPEGVALARKVMGFIDEEARRASEKLAEVRGVFPAWEASIWGPDATCARRPDGSRIRPERRLRNSNITTVAPTGTISIFAGCSGGIEPLFAVAFMRNQAGSMMPDVNEDFVRIAKSQGWYSEDLMERIASEGHIHFDEVPRAVQRVFVTAHDIPPEWHVRMQAAFQAHTDSAISKTTNFPHEATEDEVRAIYELAYQLDCKGVTVYRDGCRPMQVLSTGKTGKKEEKTPAPAEVVTAANAELEQALADAREEAHRLRVERQLLEAQYAERDEVARATRHKRHRPEILRGRTIKMNSPLGDLYVTINEDEGGRPFEVFTTLGKAGGAANADAEAIGRLASLALRSGIPITAVRDQLRGISCDRAVGIGPSKVLSAPDAIAQAIERYLVEREGVQEELLIAPKLQGVSAVAPQASAAPRAASAQGGSGDSLLATCPECGSSHMAYEEGCMKCYVCGYSECG